MPFMVIQGHFDSNRTRMSRFLLVTNSNLSPVLPHFRDIAGFLLRTATLPLVHPNFGGVTLPVLGLREAKTQGN